MARAIHQIEDVQSNAQTQQAKQIGGILQDLANDADGMREFMKTIRLLHEKGMLNIVNAILEQGSDIMRIIVDQAGKPEYAGGLKNSLSLVQLLSSMDTKPLGTMVRALGDAQEQVTREGEKRMGLFGMVGALRDPDISSGMAFMMQVLKSMGQELNGKGRAEKQES